MTVPGIGAKKIALQALQALGRFPLAVFCACTAFVLLVVRNHLFAGQHMLYYASNLTRLALTAIAGIPLFFAFHIFCEGRALDVPKKIGFALLGLCLLGLHFFTIPPDYYNFELNYTLRYVNLVLCLHLFVSVCLYFKESTIAWFWQYNKSLFIQFITTVSFSAALALGLCAAFYATERLFSLQIKTSTYFDVIFFCGLVFNTILFMYNVPSRKGSWETPISYSNALRIFIQYICLPLIVLYATILGTYLLTVFASSQLPNRAVALPILAFGALCVLTYLLAYPIKAGKFIWVSLMCKYIYFVLLPFLIVQVLTVGTRMRAYGLTENRYMAIILGLWLIGICVYMILSKLKNITVIPLSLGIVLAFASLGKVGMYGMSASNQHGRLLEVLQKNNLIVKHKLTIPHAKNLYLTELDKSVVLASLKYLYTRGELHRLDDLLNAKDKAKVDKMLQEGYDVANFGALFGDISLEPVAPSVGGNDETFTFATRAQELHNEPMQLFGGSRLLQFDATDYEANNIEQPILNPDYTIPLLKNNRLQLTRAGDTLFTENISSIAQLFSGYLASELSDSSFFGRIGNLALPYTTHYYSRDSMCLRVNNATIYFDELRLIKRGPRYLVSYARGYTIF
jgi:hypothetical protein